MTKLNRILLALFVVQGAILGSMFFLREKVGVASVEKVFPDLDPKKVSRISISGPKGVSGADPEKKPFVIERSGAGWIVPAAQGYPADAKKIDEFLAKLGRAEARGTVVTAKKHHARLEVADDRYQRLVELTVDGKPVVFRLGSSTSRAVHLRKGSDDAVLPVEGLKLWDVGEGAANWIARDLVKVDEKELWNVRVENGKGSYDLVRGADGKWSVVGGVGGDPDESAIEDLARKAANLQADDPVGKGIAPGEGLEKPLATVTLETGKPKEGGGRPDATTRISFTIGAKLEAKGRYYAKASTSEWVVEVGSWSVEPLVSKGKGDLKKKPVPPGGAQGSVPGSFPMPG
jgi:hypothetical protein